MNHDPNRRDFLAAGGAMALAGIATTAMTQDAPAATRDMAALVPGAVDEEGNYVLPKLPYAYDAVSEVIDAETMQLHHEKHHAAYVRGLIAAEKALAEARAAGSFAMVDHWSRQAAFHGGGHFLHCIFWDSIGPDTMGGRPTGDLAKAIECDFGSHDAMWAHLAAASKGVEGSGWGLLAYSFPARKLVILAAQNQQLNTQWGIIPLLPIDVWEHAYYVKYRNNRAAYVDAFPAIINWGRVAARFEIVRG